MKTVSVIGLLAILLVPVLGMSATRISVGTGPWSGVYFPVGEALTKVLNKHIPGMEAVPTPAVGSAHALELVHSGEVSLAIVGLATAHFGVRGQREFTRKYDNVGFVMAGMDAGQSLVTRAVSALERSVTSKVFGSPRMHRRRRRCSLLRSSPTGSRKGTFRWRS